MLRDTRWIALALLAACGGPTNPDDTTDDTDISETDDTTDTTDPTQVPLTTAPTGNFDCFTPAADFDDVVWAPTQTPITEPGNVDVNGVVQDFEQEEPRSGRTASIWYADAVTGTADVSGNVDSSGAVTLEAPACQPVAWGTKEITGLNEAKPTFKAHQVYGQGSGGSLDAEFQSVSNDTYLLIPTILNIPIDPTKGIIAGTMYDCARDPDTLPSVDTGKVQGIRVRVTDLQGNAVPGVKISYFTENFPDRDQGFSSADGLWGAFNVPEGEFRVEAYGLIDGVEKVVGATTLRGYPDSINIANIWAGYADGVKYPAACVEPVEVVEEGPK